MPTTTFDVASIKQSIEGKLQRYFGLTVAEANNQQIYRAVASTVRDQIMKKWMESRMRNRELSRKQVYYLSVEYLLGRSLNTNVINLCNEDDYHQALKELGIDLQAILPVEPDPALGNGGLGRLAACFLDSLASLDIPAMGCTIRYEYGLFRQKIVDGQQVELPDSWLDNGNSWEMAVMEDACEVHFGGRVETVEENGVTKYVHRDYNTVELSPRTLRDDYLPAYKAAIDAGCEMVMTSFNTLDRVPSTANRWLMRDVLRGEMGFDSVLISDWGAVMELVPHGIAADFAQAATFPDNFQPGGLCVKLAVRIADMQPRCKRLGVALVQFSIHTGKIDFGNILFRRNDPVCKLTVGRDDEQPLRILIQPARRHAAHRRIHRRQQVHHRRLFFVPRSGQHTLRFVHHHMTHSLIIEPAPAERHHAVFRINLRACIALHAAVHSHAPRADHIADLRTRPLSKQRKQLVQAHCSLASHAVSSPSAQEFQNTCLLYITRRCFAIYSSLRTLFLYASSPHRINSKNINFFYGSLQGRFLPSGTFYV